MPKETTLETLCLRLAMMVQGFHPEADQILVTLRRQLDNGADAELIREHAQRLARIVMSVREERDNSPPSEASGTDLSGIGGVIQAIPASTSDRQRVAKQVSRILSGNSALARQKEMIDLLQVVAALHPDKEASSGGKNGFLAGIRKKNTTASDSEEPHRTLYTKLMDRLTQHLDVLNGNSVKGRTIRDALSSAMQPAEAKEVLQNVLAEIEEIDTRVRQERTQTTEFLGDLHSKLSGFESILASLVDSDDSSVSRSQELREQVVEDARQIRQAVDAPDIATLRTQVEQGLSSIGDRLAQHLEAEKQHNEASREQISELNTKLASLENEAEVLRSEVRTAGDLAMKDPLTGVYNRTGYEERAAELYARWQRARKQLALVFVDCNRFKQINDSYGHAAGDLVLTKVADVLRSRSRASDVVCRYGGDEFVVMLPDTRMGEAETFAKSAFQDVIGAGFNDNGKPIDVSISCGITELKEGDEMEDALARADEAMYVAKSKDELTIHSIA